MSRNAQVKDEEDCAWLVLATRGNHEAWGWLYDRHAPALLAAGIQLLANRTEAEDVLHAVFLEAWGKAGTFDPGRGTVKTWLMVRMRSRCKDRLKSPAFSKAESLARETQERIRPGTLEMAIDAGKAQEHLRALPEELQTVLLLGYFGGLSGSEIAARLKLPLGTVKSRTAAGLAALRRTMGMAPIPAEPTGTSPYPSLGVHSEGRGPQ